MLVKLVFSVTKDKKGNRMTSHRVWYMMQIKCKNAKTFVLSSAIFNLFATVLWFVWVHMVLKKGQVRYGFKTIFNLFSVGFLGCCVNMSFYFETITIWWYNGFECDVTKTFQQYCCITFQCVFVPNSSYQTIYLSNIHAFYLTLICICRMVFDEPK